MIMRIWNEIEKRMKGIDGMVENGEKRIKGDERVLNDGREMKKEKRVWRIRKKIYSKKKERGSEEGRKEKKWWRKGNRIEGKDW